MTTSLELGIGILLGANPSGASVVDLLYKNLIGSARLRPQSILDEYLGSMIDSGSIDRHFPWNSCR